MTHDGMLIAGLLLALKHFVFDGPAQTPYQYLNKGEFAHPGGLLHAALHGFATAAIFSAFGVAWLGIVDAIVHYFIDLVKVRATKRYRWSRMIEVSTIVDRERPAGLLITSDWYFYALIADQCLHFATYVFLLWMVM